MDRFKKMTEIDQCDPEAGENINLHHPLIWIDINHFLS
jgi:hypothetical protein